MKFTANIGDDTAHFVEFIMYDAKCYLVNYGPGISFKMKQKKSSGGQFIITDRVTPDIKSKEQELQGAIINSLHGFHWE